LKENHIVVVAYCSYCREYKGRHTHRGIHSSSHNSRRRDLSDAKTNTWKMIPILGERAKRHSSRGIYGHRGSICYISLELQQSNIPYSKGILLRGNQRNSGRGSIPKDSSGRGSIPKERTTIFH
jgi:hypothetical protein